ncbi:MAG: amidohydrolase [Spirochaetes bacterium]|nr:amidohydrolase [Spirochaetota bacterium]MBU1080623.1 amidohydrolase [Spirochaetota bacterium]
MSASTTIEQRVNDALPWIVDIRREIHRNPERSGQETKTQALVVARLKELGVEVKTGFYGTGVSGVIRGSRPGRTVGLRFDMDALEMQELNEHEYKSAVPGMMHACGHDGHTAMGLGVARVLMGMRDELAGTVKLVFQPAEEDAQSGGGAQYMIRDGVLSDPSVDAMVGMHLWPDLELGSVGTKPGAMMAGSDPFIITVKGKGGHASLPHRTVDPIYIGSQIVSSLQSVVSRNVDPFEAAVVTVGVFQGGSRYNVIPETATIQGTVRSFDEGVRMLVRDRVIAIAEKTAEALGGSADVDYRLTYPPLVNDPGIYAIVKASVATELGAEKYVEVARPAPGGEDFAFFAKAVPSAYLFLGYRKPGETPVQPHNPRYDFDEAALGVGVRTMVRCALDLGRGE